MTEDSDPSAELEAAVEAVFDTAPRLSPAGRRFMAGDMGEDEARALGYLPPSDAA